MRHARTGTILILRRGCAITMAWLGPSAVVAAHASASDVAVPLPHATIYDGTPATTCQWPTTGVLDFKTCTTTLVSPWIVITAAHCVGDEANPGAVVLGETLDAPSHVLPIEYCRRGPDWNPDVNQGVGGSDISYCKLQDPVYDFPVTPIVYGCETDVLVPGLEVNIVGFGVDGPELTGKGTKRLGVAQIEYVDPQLTEVGIVIGGPDQTPCSGDSGGPAFVQYADGSWHVFGVVSGGPPGCPADNTTYYTAMHAWVPWIEADSGIDITPCHDTDGTWNPTAWCQGFELDPFDDGAWDELCLGDVSPPSTTCGDAFDATPDAYAPSVVVTAPVDATIYDEAPADVPLRLDVDDGQGWGVRFVRVAINGEVHELALREPPYEVTLTLPQGVYDILGIAEDWAGNIGHSEIVRIGVDAELPGAEESTGSSGAVDGGTGTSSTSTASTSEGASGDTASTEGSTGGPPQDDDVRGCGCTTGGDAGGLAVFGAAGWVRRRRRLGPTAPAAASPTPAAR